MKRNKTIAVALENTLHIIAITFILAIALQSSNKNSNIEIASEEQNTQIVEEEQLVESKISRNDEDIEMTARHMARTKNAEGSEETENNSNQETLDSQTQTNSLEELEMIELEQKVQERLAETYYKKLEEVTISVDMDLTVRTGISKADFKTLISNVSADTSQFFYNNSDLIYDLCEEYSINEIFFCGLISAESGWDIASNHRRTYNYISLMSSSGLIQFSSVEEGLEVAARTLHNNYLSEGGCFYYGKTLSGVKTKFCPVSDTWVGLVYGRMQQIINSK